MNELLKPPLIIGKNPMHTSGTELHCGDIQVPTVCTHN